MRNNHNAHTLKHAQTNLGRSAHIVFVTFTSRSGDDERSMTSAHKAISSFSGRSHSPDVVREQLWPPIRQLLAKRRPSLASDYSTDWVVISSRGRKDGKE